MGIIIKNVHVFDGRKDCGVKDIAFENGIIVENAKENFIVIDGTGKTLLPGLFDCHVHVYEHLEFLKKASSYGITTLCEMGNRSVDITNLNKSHTELANVLSSYGIATAPTSVVYNRMNYSKSIIVHDEEEGRTYVRKMVEIGADYIKIILEEPEVIFPLAIGKAIIDEAHKYNKKVIAHAPSIESFKKGAEIGLDILTHMPMNIEIPDNIVKEVVKKKITLIPTILIMDRIAENIHKINPNAPVSKEMAVKNLTKFVKAGVKILAGTDANELDPYPPASATYGITLLEELENQRDSGMDNISNLISATSGPADYFQQNDKGVIEAGRRADLLMVKGNPLVNLKDIYNTEMVWLGGKALEKIDIK